jgi:cyclophilin family peptidyl-prolyl cis-trans isomerase
MKVFIAATILFVSVIHTSFAQSQKVKIQTEYGDIILSLYDETPKHRDNMVKLTQEKFFDSTLFHRVIPNFVIQGGDPESKQAQPSQILGSGEVGYRVDAEINDSAFHKYGALGMARDGNPQKASSGCQFYIVTGKKYTEEELNGISTRSGRYFSPTQMQAYQTIGGTPMLDGGYTIFGEVLSGMDIVEKISLEARNKMDRPDKDIRMISVSLLDETPQSNKKIKRSKNKQ